MQGTRRLRQLRSLLFIALLGFSLQANAQSGVSPTVLSLPTGPGSLGGIGENVQANLNMGLMSYQIKILVPQGRGSATPNPNVTYSSSSGSSMLGIGWNFSAGAHIERGTVRGLPTYTNEDVFFAGKELVKLPKGPFYRARMESGFVRYEWKQKDSSDQQGYWIAQYPDGSKAFFGANAKGQIVPDAQVSGAQGTFRWELVTKIDRNGNRIEYTYFKDASKAYPDQISWVFGKDGNPLYQLRFNYEDRKDHISDGKPGFDVQTKKRLKEVQITSAGQRFRSYSFEYEDTTGLSRLIKVTRYGRDASKAYPVQFSIQYSEATIDPQATRLVNMPTALGLDMSNGNADFLDINGDGLPDLVNTATPQHRFHINQLKLDKDMKQLSHDFPKQLTVQNPKAISAKLSNSTVQLMDVNGDGYTDLVDAVNMKIYINKGNSRWEDLSETLKQYPISANNPNVRFFDYDGDKKTDIIFSDGTITYYWVNDGKGDWIKKNGNTDIGASFDKDKLRLIDMNGDGLMDVVWITKDSLRYRKYLGYGKWSGWIKVLVDLSSVKNFPLSDKAQFNDMNGDGMADMVMLNGSKIYYMVNRNGNTFTDPIELNTGNLTIPDASKMTIRIVDINGNGSRDIVWINGNGGVTYLELFKQRPNLMKEISNGIGQRINVQYGSSVYFKLRDDACDKKTDKACAGPWENKMPMAFTVVTGITTWASKSDKPAAQNAPTADERPQVQKIYYHHGFYDGKEKKFRGYRHVETLFDGDNSMTARKEELKYDIGDKDTYMHGKLLEKTTSDNAGNIYHKETMTYGDCPVELGGIDGKSLPFPIRFICTKATEKLHIEGLADQSKWKLTRAESTFDGYGNITSSINLGEKDKDGDEQVTKMTFITPADPNEANSQWLLRYPSKIEHCSSSNGPCSQTEIFYDGDEYKGLPAGQVSKGNISRIRQRAADGKFIEPTRNKYDERGNVVGRKTATGQLRTFAWDETYQRFPAKETVVLKNVTLELSTRWDYARSKVLESTDVNGQSTRYAYDSFGRLTEVFAPGAANGKPSTRYTYELQAPISRVVTDIRSKADGDFDHQEIRCFDGLNRKLAQMVMLKAGSYYVSGQVEFNREGKPARSWNNYKSDGTCNFTAPAGVGVTKYSYDGLGRNTRKEAPDGSITRIAYEPFKMVLFDAEDNNRNSPNADTPETLLMDGLGRVIERITMPKKGQTISTQFGYSNANVHAADLRTSVTLADGSIKKQEFDQLGNMTKLIDPDRSTTTYTYNPDNQITSVTDARGIKTVYTYDGLRRVLTRQQEGKDDTRVIYSYDLPHEEMKDATHLKGRLVRIAYPGGSKLNSYNTRGKVIASRHIMMGHTFDFKHKYNNANQLMEVTFPDGRTQLPTYDKANRLTALKGKIESISYGDRGLRSEAKLSNGIDIKYRYDERLRLTGTDIGGGKVMALTYSFDAMSNPGQIKQTHGDVTFTNQYTYDALYRLTQASIADGSDVVDYKQDDLHNVLTKTSSLGAKSAAHIGDYRYDVTKVHAATKAGKYTMAYDKAGNMTKRNGVTFSWDYLHRLTQATQNDKAIARYWYEETHRRTIKEENGKYVFYVSPVFEIREGAMVSYLRNGLDRQIASWSTKGVAAFFDDLDKDGKISTADAWKYHANREGIAKAEVKKRPFNLNMTRTMLESSAMRTLLGDTEVTHYYHADQLGNVRAVTDQDGKVIKRMHYTPYGAIRAQSGNPSIFSYGYQGQEYDKTIGVWAFLKRSLDPKLGRWLSADPEFAAIKGTNDEFNSYGMVENNPIAYRDQNGTSKVACGAAVALSLLAVGLGTAMVANGAGALPNPFTNSDQGQPAMIAVGAIGIIGGILSAVGSVAIFKQANKAKAAPASVAAVVPIAPIANPAPNPSAVPRQTAGAQGEVDAQILAQKGNYKAQMMEKMSYYLDFKEGNPMYADEGQPNQRRRSSATHRDAEGFIATGPGKISKARKRALAQKLGHFDRRKPGSRKRVKAKKKK